MKGIASKEALEEADHQFPPEKMVLVEYVSRWLNEISEALQNRPTPSGKPHSAEARAKILRDIQSALTGIDEAYNDFFGLFQLQPDDMPANISSPAMKAEKNIRMWIDIYHNIWKRPFPKGEEGAQILLSASPEKVLREILRGMRQVIKIVDDPVQAVKEAGSESITIALTIDLDREADLLDQYLEKNSLNGQLPHAMPEPQPSRPQMPKFRLLGATLLIISLLIIIGLFASGQIILGILASVILLNLLLSDK